MHTSGIGFDLRHQLTKILFGTAKNVLQSKRSLGDGTKGVSRDNEAPVLDETAHHAVDGTFMLLRRSFGSLRIAKGALFLVLAIALEFGVVRDGSIKDGGEHVPCSEFLLKTSDGTLKILDLMTSTMESMLDEEIYLLVNRSVV